MYKWSLKKQLMYSAAAGVVGLLLALQHAYDLLALYGVLGTFTLLVTLRDRRIPWLLVKSNLAVGLISWWPGLYSLWLTRTSPVWKEVLAQFSNAGVYTPDPFHLVILMGLPLLVAVLTFDGLFPLNKNFMSPWPNHILLKSVNRDLWNGTVTHNSLKATIMDSALCF